MPTGAVSVAEGLGGTTTYLTVIPQNLATGYSISNSTYGAWCFDYYGGVPNGYYSFQVYSSYGPNLPSNLENPNDSHGWSEVNWLLNNKTGYNADEPGATVTELQDESGRWRTFIIRPKVAPQPTTTRSQAS